MYCEDARESLFARLDGAPADQEALQAHLETCADCQALSRDMQGLAAQARVWHDVTPPRWNPHPAAWRTGAPAWTGREGWRQWLQQWFPPLASAAALLLAAGLYLQSSNGVPAGTTPAATDVPAAPANQVLAVSRQERQQELEALPALLKAEMDRRSLETEQSLKYIISHQIQSQRQLDSLGKRLETVNLQPAPQL
jgi:hypothetical protein